MPLFETVGGHGSRHGRVESKDRVRVRDHVAGREKAGCLQGPGIVQVRRLSQAQRDMNAIAAKVGRRAVVFKDMQL
jgi:hypothetical protein